MSVFRIISSFCFKLAITSCLLAGCDNNVVCQAPPPSFFFRVVNNGLIYPTPTDTSATLTISYFDAGQRKTIADLKENEGFFDSSEIISRSWALNNPEFNLEFNDQELTTIKFDTYINNAKCQGWPSISNVYENGQPLQKTENRFFVLGDK